MVKITKSKYNNKKTCVVELETVMSFMLDEMDKDASCDVYGEGT